MPAPGIGCRSNTSCRRCASFQFPEGEYRYVIHAATEARAKLAAEAPLEMLSTIVAGTERALEFAVTHGTRKFLLTSSGAVYGKQPADLTHVPESYAGAPDPLNPANVYAEGKRTAELLCAFTGRVAASIARLPAAGLSAVRFSLDRHFAVGNFIGDVLAGRPIQINGDGTPRRSYLYAADFAVWLWTILFRAPALMPFNVGSAHDVSILRWHRRSLGFSTRRRKFESHDNPFPGARRSTGFVADRAREVLGLRQTIGLEECIRRTARWYAKERRRHLEHAALHIPHR